MKHDKEYKDEVAASFLVQKEQRKSIDGRIAELKDDLSDLSDMNKSNSDELDSLLASAMELAKCSDIPLSKDEEEIQCIAEEMVSLSDEERKEIEVREYEMLDIVDAEGDWSTYYSNVCAYADRNGIDLSKDPFDELMTQTEKNEIAQRIRDDYLMQKANCDKYDYMIAAFCGCICGLIDSFFVGAPGESKAIPKWTDKKADDIVKKVSQSLWEKDSKTRNKIKESFTGDLRSKKLKEAGVPYNQNVSKKPKTLQQCIQYLEKKYKVNYDSPMAQDLKSGVKNMTPKNHHLKSLGHYPDLIGLIFSVLDQFTDKESFVDQGRVIRCVPVKKENQKDIDRFELRGGSFITKLLCGIVNWLGHLCSDLVGSNTTRTAKTGENGEILKTGRGMGIPVPMSEIFMMCNFKLPDTDGSKKTIQELAMEVYENGYDLRFAAATAIPVLLNEFLIRLLWSIKSRFYHKRTWKESIPFGNHPELRRMLLTGHGVLCTVDAVDAALRSGDLVGFIMHLNITAWTRLAISGLQEVRAIYSENVMNIVEVDRDLEKEWRQLYEECVTGDMEPIQWVNRGVEGQYLGK